MPLSGSPGTVSFSVSSVFPLESPLVFPFGVSLSEERAEKKSKRIDKEIVKQKFLTKKKSLEGKTNKLISTKNKSYCLQITSNRQAI